MADKGCNTKVKPPIGDVANPEGLYRQMLHYLEYCAVSQDSVHTVAHREECLRRFLRWCDERDLQEPTQITLEVVERYKAHLFYYRKASGKPMTVGTQRNLLVAVKMYFRYLAKQKRILFNPAAEVEMPKERGRLPRDILSTSEMTVLLKQPDIETAFGVRDRAIMETMYSTGVRRLECVKLELRDIDVNRETLFVREGKGGKDRLIPIGKRALHWIERYLNEVRPCHAYGKKTQALFLTQYGKPLSASYLSDQVTRYLKKSGFNKEGSSHLLRHSMATHMLDNGADIRFIQVMLGHADVGTTEIYTHVSIGQLKKIHSQTHPAQAAEQ